MKNILTNITKFTNSFFSGFEVAIDLGTANTRIAIHEKGVVLREASYIGFNSKTNEFLFFGDEAREIFGKSPGFINVYRPIQNGIISDFDGAVVLMKYFLEKSVNPFFMNRGLLKTRLIAYTTIAASATEVEQKAIEEALIKAGISEVFIIEKPIANAAGIELPVFSNRPIFIVDMGAGSIEMAIIVMGGVVSQKTFKNAGNYMDKLIYNYLHLKYGIILGDLTIENLKINLLDFTDNEKVHTVRGKSLENGLPKSIRVKSGDIKEALSNNFNQMIDAMKEIIETIPPELIDEIIKSGIYLTGSLANIKGIDDFISKDLKIPVIVPQNPQDATILGIMRLIKNKPNLKKVLI